jgi:MFS transporter, FHS family, glucose/mannose:H+ symporter
MMTGATKYLLLATGLAAFILLGLAQAIFGPVLPVYAKSFGLQISSVGWLLSLFWGGCLAAVIAVYIFPSHLGPKWGLALAALGTALLALMHSWALVLLGGALFGAGYGVIAAVYNPRVLSAFGPRGPAMMSLLNAIFTLGAIAAPQIFLIFDRDPTLTFWLFTGFAGLILAVTTVMGDTRVEAQAETGVLRIDWPILGFAALGIGIESSLVGLGPTALVIAGQSEEQATGLLSLFFIAYLIARLSLVFIANLVPAFLLYITAMTLTGALAAGILLGGDPALLFPLMGFGCGFFFYGAYLTGLMRMGSSTRVSAIMLGAGLCGAIVLPILVTQALGFLGPKGFFIILASLTSALLVAALWAAPRLLRRKSL